MKYLKKYEAVYYINQKNMGEFEMNVGDVYVFYDGGVKRLIEIVEIKVEEAESTTKNGKKYPKFDTVLQVYIVRWFWYWEEKGRWQRDTKWTTTEAKWSYSPITIIRNSIPATEEEKEMVKVAKKTLQFDL